MPKTIVILCLVFNQILLIACFGNQEVAHENLTSTCCTKYWNCSTRLDGDKLSYYLSATQTVDNLQSTFNAYATTPGSSKYTNVMRKTVDFCKFINSSDADQYLKEVYQRIVNDKQNHVFTKCPIEKGNYKIMNYVINNSEIPPMPNLKFYTDIEMFMMVPDRVRVMRFVNHGVLQTKSKRKRSKNV